MQRGHRDAITDLERLSMRWCLCDELAVFPSNYSKFAELFELEERINKRSWISGYQALKGQ
jgi:hypothetical protein